MIRAEVERMQVEVLAVKGTGFAHASVAPFDPADWMTGIVVGGYQPNSFFPWLWTWEEPARPGVGKGLQWARAHEGPSGEDGPASGLDFWGGTRALERLVHGYDRQLLERLKIGMSNDFEENQLPLILEESRWKIVLEGMPIQDAADLARFILQTGAGYEHFGEGTPQIGGCVGYCNRDAFDNPLVRAEAVDEGTCDSTLSLGDKTCSWRQAEVRTA